MDNKKLVIQPKLRGEDGYNTFSIRIPKETTARLNKISAQTGHSRNELIGMFLDFALEHCVIEGGGE